MALTASLILPKVRERKLKPNTDLHARRATRDIVSRVSRPACYAEGNSRTVRWKRRHMISAIRSILTRASAPISLSRHVPQDILLQEAFARNVPH